MEYPKSLRMQMLKAKQNRGNVRNNWVWMFSVLKLLKFEINLGPSLKKATCFYEMFLLADGRHNVKLFGEH